MAVISTIFLIDLAFDVSNTWKKLARAPALGLGDDVDTISENYSGNVVEQAYRMLLSWKQGNGASATLQVLSEALKDPIVARSDLARKYCENDYRSSWNTEIRLEGQLRRGQVPTSVMNSISKDLGKCWLWVGRLLGIKDAILDSIKESNSQLYECSVQMLKAWAQMNASQATYENLARALLHRAVLKRKIVEDYCLEHQQPQSVGNRPGVSSSASGLSGPLSHMGIQGTMDPSEKQEISLEENKCLWNQEVQNIDGFQDLLTVLKIHLDPKRDLGGDYQSLAGVFGKNMNYTWYLATKASPIEELLKECRPTLSSLNKSLLSKEVNREDVAKEITAWVKKKGCSCSKCGTSLL